MRTPYVILITLLVLNVVSNIKAYFQDGCTQQNKNTMLPLKGDNKLDKLSTLFVIRNRIRPKQKIFYKKLLQNRKPYCNRATPSHEHKRFIGYDPRW